MQSRDNYYCVRKTSAEIVKEARKSLTANKQFNGIGQVKIVSTKRPITPAINFEKRQLYGRDVQVPVDRPPSAFNLKYLQHEARALPTLEPLKSEPESPVKELAKTMQRSESLGNFNAVKFKATLPSLTENTKTMRTSHSSDNLCQQPKAAIPLSKDKKIKKSIENLFTPDQLLRSNCLLSQTTTENLISLLKQFKGFDTEKDLDKNVSGCLTETSDHLCMVLRELYSRIVQNKINPVSRNPLLSAIYGLVECNSSKVLLGIAQIILGLGVGGSNLTGAFKLIFKIAKNEHNDALFVDSDLPELMVDALGKISPLPDGEPEGAIYCYGAIRFLAMSGSSSASPLSGNLKISKHKHLPYRLMKHGIIQLMTLHIQIFNEYGSVKEIEGQSLHALYQLLASLRVLLSLPVIGHFVKTRNSSAKVIVNEGNDIHLEVAGQHLIKVAFVCLRDHYVLANVIRTLSVLSDIESCCNVLSKDVVKLGQMVGMFKLESCVDVTKQKTLGLISRLGYIIGNIMERNDESRLNFFRNDVVMHYTLELIYFFSNQSYEIRNSNGDSVADILIKFIRIIANISVNSEVGYLLNLKPILGSSLLNILRNVKGKESTLNEYRELLYATLAALHNLTYYQTSTDMNSFEPGSVIDKIQDICGTLCKEFLVTESSSEKIEVIRVLGNMTRNNSVREIFFSSNGMCNIVKCLAEDDENLLENSCGVLVNILNDSNSRNSFKNLSGMLVLRESLKRNINEKNWLLCETICKAFWNFLIDSNDLGHEPDANEIDSLSNDLAEYLDEETIFKGNEPKTSNYEYEEWEKFATIAADLLEFLQSNVQVMDETSS